MITVYVSVGNSDDKLTQVEWSSFYLAVEQVIRRAAHRVHGAWVSQAADPWQNGCWGFEIGNPVWLRGQLRNLAGAYRQDSIAWAEAPKVEFLGAPR